MDEIIHMEREDIDRAIDPGQLRTTQIIEIAILVAPLIMLAVFVAVAAQQSAPAEAGDYQFIDLLLSVLGLFTLGTLVAALVIPRMILEPRKLAMLLKHGRSLPGGKTAENPVDWMIQIHRMVVIIRLALTEGSALPGLVVLLIASLGGQIRPTDWLALIPLGLHLWNCAATFTTRAGLVEFMAEQIVKPLRGLQG